MNKLAVLLIAMSAILSGCVADSGVRYHDGDGYRDGTRYRGDRDRDGDGVPNRRDSHPDNPRRGDPDNPRRGDRD